MTAQQLQALGIDVKWLEPLNRTFTKYDISTPKRQAAFIGQCSHESANFKNLEENLKYSPERLMKIWPSRFPDIETAAKYAHQPQLLANKVYAGRLGNNQDNDGYNYRGRGLIQLTGRELYSNCATAIGVDIVNNPQLLLEPSNACMSAGWYWNKKGLNSLADSSDFETMTKRINGGIHGLDDRKARIAKAIAILG